MKRSTYSIQLSFLTAMVSARRFVARRLSAGLSETRYHYIAAKEAVTGRRRAEELPAGIKLDVYVESGREDRC